MTTDSLINLLEALRKGVDPRTGELFNMRDSCLSDPEVGKGLKRFIKLLLPKPEEEAVDIPDAVIKESCAELRSLGYQPTVMQVAKVFIGSRSIVDRNLKALTSYSRYRGIYTRSRIHTHLMDFHRRNQDLLPEFAERTTRTVDEPWREVDFFRTERFDKLDADKETELRQAIAALGLRKKDNRLPEYMATARESFPRSFEPWIRDEQALLIEAMCYTNDLDKLAAIFGRSARSIESSGQRLIWGSQEKQRQQVA